MSAYKDSILGNSMSSNLFRNLTGVATSLAICISAAACTVDAPAGPFDVGNMAYPEPQSQGEIGPTAVSGRTFDTGNMALPTPQPQGDIAVTRVH